MKLYPIAPNAESVARHFERMASGRVHTTRGQRAGYGFLGSRINLGSYTVMKGGAGTKENPQTVRGISPTEVGIQQAKSELQAQSHVLNKNKKDKKDKKDKKKKTTTVIKPKGAKGKGQSKPGERGSKTSAKKGSGAKGKGVKKATKGAGARARAAGTCKKRKTKKEEADELKKKKLNKLKRLAAEKKAKAKAKAKTDNFA
jgi:hypothetical protein